MALREVTFGEDTVTVRYFGRTRTVATDRLVNAFTWGMSVSLHLKDADGRRARLSPSDFVADPEGGRRFWAAYDRSRETTLAGLGRMRARQVDVIRRYQDEHEGSHERRNQPPEDVA